MFAKLNNKTITNLLEGMGSYCHKEVIPVYKVVNNFYSTVFDEESGETRFISPCDGGENLQYEEKQSWMQYFVPDMEVYGKLYDALLDDIQQQDYYSSFIDIL